MTLVGRRRMMMDSSRNGLVSLKQVGRVRQVQLPFLSVRARQAHVSMAETPVTVLRSTSTTATFTLQEQQS
jgi:hypothetical protein